MSYFFACIIYTLPVAATATVIILLFKRVFIFCNFEKKTGLNILASMVTHKYETFLEFFFTFESCSNRRWWWLLTSWHAEIGSDFNFPVKFSPGFRALLPSRAAFVGVLMFIFAFSTFPEFRSSTYSYPNEWVTCRWSIFPPWQGSRKFICTLFGKSWRSQTCTSFGSLRSWRVILVFHGGKLMHLILWQRNLGRGIFLLSLGAMQQHAERL